MTKFGKLLIATVTLLAFGLLLLGPGGAAVGGKDKKSDVKDSAKDKKTDGKDGTKDKGKETNPKEVKKVNDKEIIAVLIGMLLPAVQKVNSIDHVKGTIFVDGAGGNDARTVKFPPGSCVLRKNMVHFDLKHLEVGDQVEIADQAAGGSYLKVNEGGAAGPTLVGTIQKVDRTKRAISMSVTRNLTVTFLFGDASAYVNGTKTKLDQIKEGDRGCVFFQSEGAKIDQKFVTPIYRVEGITEITCILRAQHIVLTR